MYSEYERLATGIILQAVDDYRKACKDLRANSHNHETRADLKGCEHFFLSKWFEVLTSIDGEVLLSKLKTERV